MASPNAFDNAQRLGFTTVLSPEAPARHSVGAAPRDDGAKPPATRRGRPAESGPTRSESIGSDALSHQSSPLVTPHERQGARALLGQIGRQFAEDRLKSKSKAFESYQRALAINMDSLVMGGAVTMKELTVLLMDLEAFVKSSQKEGETPATMLAQFLRGDLAVDE